MTTRRNEHGQPIGPPVDNWAPRPAIPRTPMHGQHCDLEPLDKSHVEGLYKAYQQDQSGQLWTYMPTGPFETLQTFQSECADWITSKDPLFFAVIDKTTGNPLGVASFLRMQPQHGVAEVGFIAFAPALQRTVMATEAMYLMLRRVFGELGYRRYEWKCDALNAPSRAAAQRLGFQFEGIFRQAIVYKGRNRDTAWFSILDSEWPTLGRAFKEWLAPENFDPDGQQRQSLGHFKAENQP